MENTPGMVKLEPMGKSSVCPFHLPLESESLPPPSAFSLSAASCI
jgi:hypothetical protein